MPRFTFELEAVLTHRRHVERQRQRDLAEKQAVRVALEGQLQAMDQSVRQAGQDLRENHLTGALDMNYIAAHRRYVIDVQRRAVQLATKIAAATQRVEESRAKLIEAAKARKVIEKLRERRYQLWQERQAKADQAQADEVGMQLGVQAMAAGENGVS